MSERVPQRPTPPRDRLRSSRSAIKSLRPASHPPSHLIVIGASSGGQRAVKTVIKELSRDLPAATIVIRHLPALLSESSQVGYWLHDVTHLPICPVRPGEAPENGVVYVPPAGMSVSLRGQKFTLTPFRKGTAPLTVINELFSSAADTYGDRVIGIILTGMLRDGTLGLRAVHDAGGLTIVQDPAEAEYPDMPKNAMADLPVTFCLKLAEIGPVVDLLVRRKARLETGLAISIRMLEERIGLLVRLIDQSKGNDQTLTYLKTELKTLKHDLTSIQTLLDEADVD